jgi:hypothetical protein
LVPCADAGALRERQQGATSTPNPGGQAGIAYAGLRPALLARALSTTTPWDREARVRNCSAGSDVRVLDAGALGRRIAVPGCGAGHEVAGLAAADFDVIGIDYAPAAIELTRAKPRAASIAAEVVQADVPA